MNDPLNPPLVKPSGPRELSLCPCQSRETYAACCQPFHLGQAKPDTALQLMRSRYSAYFFRLADYLVSTTHPDTREPDLKSHLDQTIHQTNWCFLTIITMSKGGPDDKVGKVEFVANYFADGQPYELHERSRFKRYKGAWKYLDAKG
jgi:SEC-C motif-containing protein